MVAALPALCHAAQYPGQLVGRKRLVQEFEPVSALLGKDTGVSRCQHDRQGRITVPDCLAESTPAHAGHDHIGEYYVETGTGFRQHLERLVPVRCPGGLIPEILEDLGRELAYLDIVLNEEHAAAAPMLCRLQFTSGVGVRLVRIGIDPWQIQGERGAMPDLTFDGHIARRTAWRSQRLGLPQGLCPCQSPGW